MLIYAQKICHRLITCTLITAINSVLQGDGANVPKIGPHCLVAGHRRSPDIEGTLLLRKIDSVDSQNEILRILNDKRISERAVTTCSPIFEWDSALAEVAQQWADKCALVEYSNNSSGPIPARYTFFI